MEDIKNDKEKIEKIKNIIETEIEKELVNKQNEVTDISEKIKNILRNLELLKYIIAVNYYDQNTNLMPKKGQEDENEEEKAQTQIHPAIKRLMPFCSNYNKSFGDLLTNHSQESHKNEKTEGCYSVVDEKNKVNGNSKNEKEDSTANNIKMPHYVPPLPSKDENVGTVNSTRGNSLKDNYRVIVGNISKWIPPDTREDNSTHKWMVYIRNKDPQKDVMQLLKKVRYFLHESYKPHDIIDVTSPPFRLTRRGWGEFPIRVQLHFIHPLDKPVDIIHNLKLDMSCSGIQMLGGETVLELRLHQNTSVTSNRDISNSDSNLKSESVKEKIVREKQDVYDDSLLTNINGIKSDCTVDIKKENADDIVIKEEPEEYSENVKINSRIEELNAAINNSRKFLLDRRKAKRIIEIEHCYLKTDDSQFNNYNNFNSLLKLDNKSSGKTFKNGAALDINQVNQIFSRQSHHKLNNVPMEIASNKCEEEIFKNLKASASSLLTDSQTKYSMKVFRHMYLVNIIQRAHATKLKNLEPLVKWFVQRWPIVTRLSLDHVYKTVHPYSSPSEEEFFKCNIGKQRSAEWFRAKAIQKVLKSLKSAIPIEEEIWTTKQILLWTRSHGYSPASFQKSSKSEPAENETRNKRLKLIESSSESEDSDNPSKKFKIFDARFMNGLNATEKRKNHKKARRKEAPDVKKMYNGFNVCSKFDDPERFGINEVRVLELSISPLEIEVVEVDEKPSESPSKKKEANLSVITTPPGEILFNKFVRETAREIGVKILEEEVVEGVKADSVSRVLSQCASSFVDELLRRSFANAWVRSGNRCPDSVETNDVLATLIENPQFDIFTNRGLGAPNVEKL